MTAIIKLTSAGANTGPFDLYSDTDNYAVAFATGITKSLLLIGYLTTDVPSTATNIKIISTGACNTIIETPVPTTSTTTTKPTCYSVRYGPSTADCYVQWIDCDGTLGTSFVYNGQYLNIICAQNNTWYGCGPFVTQGICTVPTTTTTTTNLLSPPSTSTTTTSNVNVLDCNILKYGVGYREYTINLSPSGGLVTLNLLQQWDPIKFEILHNGIKKATSGMNIANAGPFDNSYNSTRPYSAYSYNSAGVLSTINQYIWNGFTGAFSSSGYWNSIPVYSRQNEYTAETGSSLLLKKDFIGAGGYKINFQQLMWWKYTSADYSVSSTVTVTISGYGSRANWQIVRSC